MVNVTYTKVETFDIVIENDIFKYQHNNHYNNTLDVNSFFKSKIIEIKYFPGNIEHSEPEVAFREHSNNKGFSSFAFNVTNKQFIAWYLETFNESPNQHGNYKIEREDIGIIVDELLSSKYN